MNSDSAVTITIRRRVKPGCEPAFEAALRKFIPQSLRHPGHLGVQVLRPAPGATPEWTVIIKFLSRSHYEIFRTSDEYTQWCAELRDLLDNEPAYEEQCGLENWFVLPGATAQPVLPRWKMAIVTWVGVNFAVISLTLLLSPWVGKWPLLLRSPLTNALVVMLLTWAIMPLLTRCFRPFLYPLPDATLAAAQEDHP